MLREAPVAMLDGRPVIVGAGVAGLATALHLAPEPCVLVSSGPLCGASSSMLAQRGLAASFGADDAPALHEADTLAAGDGLCDPSAVRLMTKAAPQALDWLESIGARFDRGPDGKHILGLEAAHSRRRIAHAQGDASGREAMRALARAARDTPSITVLEGMQVRRLLLSHSEISGVVLSEDAGRAHVLASRRVVLATGGIGGLFAQSTNPASSFGGGLALAARAGARLADMEFMQFHPTALDARAQPSPLISEAVRGEGAVLIDENGDRFLENFPSAELAPRDVVSRAVWKRLTAGGQVYLDARARPGPDFARRFPGIFALCAQIGIDPARQPIPIRPAAHYHMGGLETDLAGRASIPGLWAVGETACSGLHGANRLASNSLTEALVFAMRTAASIKADSRRRRVCAARVENIVPLGEPPDPSSIRPAISEGLGLMRAEGGLRALIEILAPLAVSDDRAADPALVGLVMAVAAYNRRESRGAHARADYPMKAPQARRTRYDLGQTLAAVDDILGGVIAAPAFHIPDASPRNRPMTDWRMH